MQKSNFFILISLLFCFSCTDRKPDNFREFSIASSDSIPLIDTTNSGIRTFFNTRKRDDSFLSLSDSIKVDEYSISFLFSSGKTPNDLVCRSLHTMSYDIVTESGSDKKFNTDDDKHYTVVDRNSQQNILINKSSYNIAIVVAADSRPITSTETEEGLFLNIIFTPIILSNRKVEQLSEIYNECKEEGFSISTLSLPIRCHIVIDLNKKSIKYEQGFDHRMGKILALYCNFVQLKVVSPFQN